MQIYTSSRGFNGIELPAYLERDGIKRLVAESSAIGDYPDSLDRPGSSFLWIGEYHHLNRDQVKEYVGHLQTWLDTGRMA